MDVEQMSVAVRERRLPELYDLTILLFRQHGWELIKLYLPVLLIFTTLNWWLLSGFHETNWGAWFPAALILACEAPLLSAFAFAYLGQSMFGGDASRRKTYRMVASSWWGLVLGMVAHGLCAVVILPLLLFPSQWVPVLVLERQKGKAARKRAFSLAAYYRGENIMHGVVNVVVIVGGAFVFLWGLLEIGRTLQISTIATIEPAVWLHPGQWWVQACLLVLMIVTCVQRFCAYLDLRTRREGWEIELRLRQEGQRVRHG